jgi:hypothetical protein
VCERVSGVIERLAEMAGKRHGLFVGQIKVHSRKMVSVAVARKKRFSWPADLDDRATVFRAAIEAGLRPGGQLAGLYPEPAVPRLKRERLSRVDS